MLKALQNLLTGVTETDRRAEALKVLGDRELADLGISRDQIQAYVARLVPKKKAL